MESSPANVGLLFFDAHLFASWTERTERIKGFCGFLESTSG